MCNQPGTLITPIEHDPVSPRATSAVGLIATQDRELVVRARDGEVETLVVLVLVRVGVGTLGVALRVHFVARGLGVVDVGLVVAGVAAVIDALGDNG